jgi:protein-S-isoprenylcysteine O-methyltransferase Ste14
MENSRLKEKLRHLLESMLTALLFGTQTILNAGWAISVMAIPLLPYLIYFFRGQAKPDREIQVLFFSKEFMVGRMIALIGFAVFLFAALQFLWNKARGTGIIKTGVYSVVRHPQFTGIIIVTIGLTVMVLTLACPGNQLLILGFWMIQILGYVGIAWYEEVHLLEQFGESFHQYQRDVPFIFPIKCPPRISEVLFTILIAVLICFVFLVFPFDLIRLH